MAEVVSINGGQHVAAGEPVPEIVAMLEQALDEARSGKIAACALAAVDGSGFVTTGAALLTYRFTLLGAVCDLRRKIEKVCED